MGCNSTNTSKDVKNEFNAYFKLLEIRNIKCDDYLNILLDYKSNNLLFLIYKKDSYFKELIKNQFIRLTNIKRTQNKDLNMYNYFNETNNNNKEISNKAIKTVYNNSKISKYLKSISDFFDEVYVKYIKYNKLLFYCLLFSFLLLTKDFFLYSQDLMILKIKTFLVIISKQGKSQFITDNTSGKSFANIFDIYMFSCFYVNIITNLSFKSFIKDFYSITNINIDSSNLHLDYQIRTILRKFSYENQNKYINKLLTDIITSYKSNKTNLNINIVSLSSALIDIQDFTRNEIDFVIDKDKHKKDIVKLDVLTPKTSLINKKHFLKSSFYDVKLDNLISERTTKNNPHTNNNLNILSSNSNITLRKIDKNNNENINNSYVINSNSNNLEYICNTNFNPKVNDLINLKYQTNNENNILNDINKNKININFNNLESIYNSTSNKTNKELYNINILNNVYISQNENISYKKNMKNKIKKFNKEIMYVDVDSIVNKIVVNLKENLIKHDLIK